MARPSKLSVAQWEEVARRHAAGEGVRSLAREFCVDEAAIRRRVTPHTPQVRIMAERLAAVQTDLAAMPVPQQYLAQSLADKLRNISTSLACAAEFGAATSYRLHALANSEVCKIDDADPLASVESLKGVSVLTKMANDSAVVPLNLLAANKDAVQRITGGNNDGPPRIVATPLDETL